MPDATAMKIFIVPVPHRTCAHDNKLVLTIRGPALSLEAVPFHYL